MAAAKKRIISCDFIFGTSVSKKKLPSATTSMKVMYYGRRSQKKRAASQHSKNILLLYTQTLDQIGLTCVCYQKKYCDEPNPAMSQTENKKIGGILLDFGNILTSLQPPKVRSEHLVIRIRAHDAGGRKLKPAGA